MNEQIKPVVIGYRRVFDGAKNKSLSYMIDKASMTFQCKTFKLWCADKPKYRPVYQKPSTQSTYN